MVTNSLNLGYTIHHQMVLHVEPTKWMMANVNKMKLHLALVIVR